MGKGNRSFQILRVAGISVYLHWSWFVVALIEINGRSNIYASPGWNVLEYLSLFLIVLLHEFGHGLACRQVGGKAERIILWPLGGIAYVSPPPRPGAVLWSIAAGPLVNIVLIPVFIGIGYACKSFHVWEMVPDAHVYLRSIAMINIGLLIFNILPIYPLDGGQILRALLWYVLGRANSLTVTVGIGFLGVAGLFVLAALAKSPWLVILAIFMLLSCVGGFRESRVLSKFAKMPRRHGFQCPTCGAAPLLGEKWKCDKCGHAFDTFMSQAACPSCGEPFSTTQCVDCGNSSPMSSWSSPALGSTPM